MSQISGKFVLDKIDNLDEMMQSIGLTYEQMKQLILAPGLTAEFNVDGSKFSGYRSDGLRLSADMDVWHNIVLGDMQCKVFVTTEGPKLIMTIILPNGSELKRTYYFYSNGMRMEMTHNNTLMKMFCNRVK